MTRIEGGTDGEITIPVGATAANRMYRNSCRIARDSRLRSRRARPPRVDLLYSCPHCGETSRGAQEAGNEVKGEKARRTRSRQRPSNEMVSLKRDRGNVPRPNLVNDNSAIPVFPWNRACNLDFLGERLSSDVSIDTYAWQGRTNGPRVKP